MSISGKESVALFRNGVKVVDYDFPESPAAMLVQYEKGPYTAVLVKQGGLAVDWELHKDRLQRSLDILSTQIPSLFQNFLKWLQDNEEDWTRMVRQMIENNVKLSWQQASQQMDISNEQDGDLMMTILVVDDNSEKEPQSHIPLIVYIHFKKLSWGKNSNVPGEVVVLGGPRSLHEAKFSQWAIDRKPLEQRRPQDALEALLCTNNGEVLEGLVSNIFIIQGVGEDAELWTADVTDGVLEGTVRSAVLKMADHFGIKVVKRAPCLTGDQQNWTEAFLTNSIRGIRPVSRIYGNGDDIWSHPPWECRLMHSHGPVTSLLQSHLSDFQNVWEMGDAAHFET